MRRAAESVARGVEQLRREWTGWPPAQAIIIYRPAGGALLLTPADPPEGFVALRAMSTASGSPYRAFWYAGVLPGQVMSGAQNYPAGSVQATTVEWSDDSHRMLELIFHETFHAFQRQRFKNGSPSEYVDSASLAAPDFIAMAEVERRILATALAASTDSAASLIHRYLAVREIRARSSPDATRVQAELERIEGSAQYVGMQFGAEQQRTAIELLNRDLSTFPGSFTGRMVRWRSYGVGAASAILLERMGVKWRAELGAGATFDEMLSHAVRFDPVRAPELAGDALTRFGFAELLAANTTPVSSGTRADPIEAFRSLRNMRLVLIMPVRYQGSMQTPQFSFEQGPSGFSQPAENVLVFPDAKSVLFDLPNIQVKINTHPVMLDMRNMAEAVRMEIALDSVPVTPALAGSGTRDVSVPSVMIENDKLIIRINRPAVVSAAGDSVVLRVHAGGN